MPTDIYALTQENRRLCHALDKRDRAIKDMTGLIERYMRHVIETKGTSYLDRHGLMPSDSKALTPWDLHLLQMIEKGVKPKCVMPSRVGGSSTEGTGKPSKPVSLPPLPGTGYLRI